MTDITVTDDRFERLTEATSKLKGRTAVTVDKLFQRVGGALLGIGLLAILAGWYGTSHTTRQWRQTPYLVSGGMLGLGLIFIGGFAYFSYWMTRMVDESRTQTRYLESIDTLLREQASARLEVHDELAVATGSRRAPRSRR